MVKSIPEVISSSFDASQPEEFTPLEGMVSTFWASFEESSELVPDDDLFFSDQPTSSSPPSYKDVLLTEPTLEEDSAIGTSIPEEEVTTSDIAKRGLKRQRTVKEIAAQAIEENLTEPISEAHMDALEKFVETIVLNVAAERHEDLGDILQHPDIRKRYQLCHPRNHSVLRELVILLFVELRNTEGFLVIVLG